MMAELSLRLHRRIAESEVNGPGLRAVLWVQGCHLACPGCWNPQTHPQDGGELWTVDALDFWLAGLDRTSGVTFSGGEPFAQAQALAELARRIHARGQTVVCFTGYTLEVLRRWSKPDIAALLAEVDLLIDGPYLADQPSDHPLIGSANQRLHFLTDRIPADTPLRRGWEITLTPDTATLVGFPGLLTPTREGGRP